MSEQLTADYNIGSELILQHIVEDICVRRQWCGGLADLPLMCDLQFQLLKYYGADTLRYCLTALAQAPVEYAQAELREKLKAAGLPIVDIHELKEKTERITGTPRKLPKGDRVVAEVISRYGDLQDQIYNVR